MARVLIIDDNKDILHMLRLILESAGHTVYEATHGEAGIRVFRQERPEIVITDIFMPVQDGLETICILKREFPTVKIVAISGGGQSGRLEYLEVARKIGADRVLAKPFSKAVLLEALQDLGESAGLFN